MAKWIKYVGYTRDTTVGEVENAFSVELKSICTAEFFDNLVSKKLQISPDIVSGLARFVQTDMLYNLTAISNYLTTQKDWNLLDIGCGHDSKQQMHGYESDITLEPWLCRTYEALTQLRMPIPNALRPKRFVGVDRFGLDSETFEAYAGDVFDKNFLKVFPDATFDVVHSSRFFNSPGAIYGKFKRKIQSRGFPQESRMLMTLLEPELERIVKPDGVILYK